MASILDFLKNAWGNVSGPFTQGPIGDPSMASEQELKNLARQQGLINMGAYLSQGFTNPQGVSLGGGLAQFLQGSSGASGELKNQADLYSALAGSGATPLEMAMYKQNPGAASNITAARHGAEGAKASAEARLQAQERAQQGKLEFAEKYGSAATMERILDILKKRGLNLGDLGQYNQLRGGGTSGVMPGIDFGGEE